MVRATLREIEQPGTGKTQTRRIADETTLPHLRRDNDIIITQGAGLGTRNYRFRRKYSIGDRLYVREAWRSEAVYDDMSPSAMGGDEPVRYEADGAHQTWGYPAISKAGRLRQGMHMPRRASRLTLIVKDVRVQRLQDISEADAIAEGVYRLTENGRTSWWPTEAEIDQPGGAGWWTAVQAFSHLWDSLNDKPERPGCSWSDNPFVVAVTFTVEYRNIDQVPA
jgi:hypothetical protein